ncbi:MAG: prolyl oligopeptidase family serine peptidase [Pirellulaceae bacterium]
MRYWIPVLLLFSAATCANAQQDSTSSDEATSQLKLLDHDTFMEMESVSSPNISPDGQLILFSRRRVDQQEDRFASNIWMCDVEGNRISELTRGDWRDTSPVWSPDGKRLAFISDRSGSSQLHVMWFDTREVAQLTHLESAPSSIAWSKDGTQICFSQFVADKESPLSIKLPSRPKGAKWADPAIIVDRLSWQRDGSGYRPPGYNHIYTIDAVLGGTPRKISDGDYNYSDPQWSLDGKTIYVTSIRKPDAEYLRGDSEIYTIDLETLEFEPLTDREGPDRGARVSPDGQWIAYTGYNQQNFTSHLSDLYLMRADGSDKRQLTEGLPNSPSSVTWAEDNSGLYFTMGEQGNTNANFVSVDGELSQVTNGVQSLSGFSLSKTGQVASVRSSFQQPGDLVTFSLAEPGNVTSLVDVNNDILDGMTLGDAEELWFTSSDGLKCQGWLIKPADFDPNKKYPMLMWIHGGPWSMYSVRFSWAFQNFAAEGYAVLYTNPRGSTGYGQQFVNGIQYSYPGKDYDDLMAGVDEALKRDWVDEENMFVCGGSGGGVLTAWIVGHTDRFRAAVSMRPVINWHSFVGTTDGSSWYHQFRSFPWEDPLEYSVRSPLRYVENVTTPTMVMTGEADLRTPMTQSEEYYRALKMLKKETLLIRMPEEYHGWRRPSHRLMQQLYLQAWFDKYRETDETESVEESEPIVSADANR